MEEQFVEEKPVAVDKKRRLTNILFGIAIFGLVVVLSLVAYGLVGGKFFSDQPATSVENKYQLALDASKKNPASGTAIAQLAEAQYAMGDKKGAYKTLDDGDKTTKGKLPASLYVVAARLGILNQDNNYKEVLRLAPSARNMADKWVVKQSSAMEGKTTNYVDTVDSSLVIDVAWNIGQAYMQDKQWAKAQQSYEIVIQYAPTLSDAWYYHGLASYELKERTQAIASLSRAADFFPTDTKIQAALKKAKELPKEGEKK